MSLVQFEIPLPSLLALPVEILQQIAISLATTASAGPPTAIVPFLSTCHHLYDAVNAPQVYAEVFRIQFDTAALCRRFVPGQINAHGLSEELLRRWTCLGRIRAASIAGEEVWHNLKRGVYSQIMVKEDMMTAYLMFLESDGRNAVHLLQWARLPDYLAKYRQYVINQSYEEPVLPCNSEESVLYVWLSWFCLDYRSSFGTWIASLPHLISYAFGTFAYEGFHAPWPYHHLPLPPSSSLPSLPSIMPQAGQQATLSPANTVFTVDNSLTPRPISTAISRYFGHTLEIAVPLVSQAATLAFVASSTQYPFYVEGTPIPSDQDLINSIPPTGFTSASNIINGDQVVFSQQSYTAPYMQTRFATITDSRAYDDEWKRGIMCRDPLRPQFVKELGVPRYRFVKGSLSGEWDGRFVKTGFETYRRIMDGETAINALEEANTHHDNHAWRVEEHYFNKQLTAALPSFRGLSFPPRPPPPSSPLNAHLPYVPGSFRSSTMWRNRRWTKGLVATTPSGDEVYYQTWDADFEDEDDSYDDDDDETINVVISGFSINRSKEVPGAHHWSMPPNSTLYGTIRKWDGLITLLATSSNPSLASESWLWRGYLVGSGPNVNWVGRYRAAHTDVNQYAYEGVFTMTKRDS